MASAFATPIAPFRVTRSARRCKHSRAPLRARRVPSASASLPTEGGSISDGTHSLDAALSALSALSKENTSERDTCADAATSGTVYLVGTGPGDPGLLTLHAVHLLQRADVVLYDRLVGDAVLGYVGANATLVYVGKEAGYHTRTQEEIHTLLRVFAQDGKTVIRLKGGDPFVFGRGGEEAAYLRAHGVRVRAVPGITAAAGIGALLGIPLTHRGVAHSVKFVTGHLKDGPVLEVDAVDDMCTLVVYMGLSQLEPLVELLKTKGLRRDTAAVAVERGTMPDQRVVFGTAEELPARVKEAGLKSPTLVVIGDVVKLAPEWASSRGEVVPEGATAGKLDAVLDDRDCDRAEVNVE